MHELTGVICTIIGVLIGVISLCLYIKDRKKKQNDQKEQVIHSQFPHIYNIINTNTNNDTDKSSLYALIAFIVFVAALIVVMTMFMQ